MKQYSMENRPVVDYGPFYNILITNKGVDSFMFAFHGIGCGGFKFTKEKPRSILLSLYTFWREKGFMTQKQIHLAVRLLEDLKLIK